MRRTPLRRYRPEHPARQDRHDPMNPLRKRQGQRNTLRATSPRIQAAPGGSCLEVRHEASGSAPSILGITVVTVRAPRIGPDFEVRQEPVLQRQRLVSAAARSAYLQQYATSYAGPASVMPFCPQGVSKAAVPPISPHAWRHCPFFTPHWGAGCVTGSQISLQQ